MGYRFERLWNPLPKKGGAVVNFYEEYKTSFPTLTVQVPNNHLSLGQRYDVNLAFGTNL